MATDEKIPPFDPHSDPATAGIRWPKWRKKMELFLVEKGIEDPARKRAALLRRAGDASRDLAEALEDRTPAPLPPVEPIAPEHPGQDAAAAVLNAYQAAMLQFQAQHAAYVVALANHVNVYDHLINLFNEHFLPQRNEHYERQVFKRMAPGNGESANAFMMRLREQAQFCNFEDRDREIRDQYISTCPWTELKEKLLGKLLSRGAALTLEIVREKAVLFERVKAQSTLSATASPSAAAVRKTPSAPKARSSPSAKQQPAGSSGGKDRSDLECFACGEKGHFRGADVCKAKKSTCGKCNKKGHFTSRCRGDGKKKGGKKQSNQASAGQEEEAEPPPRYSFAASAQVGETTAAHAGAVSGKPQHLPRFTAEVGGVPVSLLIDSGANCNVVGKSTWEHLKRSHIKILSDARCSSPLSTFGGKSSLRVKGTFVAQIRIQETGREVPAQFQVLEQDAESLLGRETATHLDVLRVGPPLGPSASTASVDTILSEFSDVFQGIGKLKNFQLRIPIDESVKPVAQPPRRVPYSRVEPTERIIHELLSHDIIEPVTGPTPWVSASHLVPKGSNLWRLCVDMRMANRAVLRERFPLPTVEEALHSLNGAQFFSKLDSRWAYHQIELTEDSREITTFSTPMGLYRFKRLFFGISCAQEMFCRIMFQIFQHCPGTCGFVDDRVVFGRTREEHDANLRQVLKTYRDHGLTLNREKCKFAVPEITYLGHKVSANGVQPSASSKEAVLSFRQPCSASEVRSFLGLAQFSARFIPDFATLAEPLRRLTKSGIDFEWEKSQSVAFEKLKEALVRSPALAYYDKTAETVLVVDASPVGVGAALLQRQGADKELRPVEYASRTLTDTERRYSQTEKEALAVVWGCEKMQLFLLGKDFTLFTDCKAIEAIFRPAAKPCLRMERYVLRLQCFKFRVEHIAGVENIADCLSRLAKRAPQPDEIYSELCAFGAEVEACAVHIAKGAVPEALSPAEIREATRADEELQSVLSYLRSEVLNWPRELKRYQTIREELFEVDGILLRGERIVIPAALRQRVLQLGHEGHLGVVGMKNRLRTKVWWSGMDEHSERFVRACKGCLMVSRPDPPAPLRRTPLPSMPWEYVGFDLLGPLPSGHYIMVVVDYYSRFFEAIVMTSTTSKNIRKELRDVFAREGNPAVLISDNAQNLTSEELEAWFRAEGIEREYSTPGWPQANGETERQNASLMKRLRIAHGSGSDWREELTTFLVAYRSTPHNTTGVSPSKLFRNREMRTKLPSLHLDRPLLDESVRDRDALRKLLGKEQADEKRRAKFSTIREHDIVLMEQPRENKLSPRFGPQPMVVTKREGTEVTVLNPETGGVYTRNASRFKKVVTPEEGVETPTSPHEAVTASESGSTDAEGGPSQVADNPMPPAQRDPSPHEPAARPQRERRAPAWQKDYLT